VKILFKIMSCALLLLGATLFIYFYPTDLYADTHACSQEEAYAAEQESDRLENWDDLYRSFRKYHHCDDGAISEGYSYTVTKLLTMHWKEAGDLVRLSKKSKKFENFVISHVNETMSQLEADQVLRSATDRCPVDGASLCERLKLAVQN
jgi:hypothetical protein